MTIACNRLIVLSWHSLLLLFDDAESNSMSESLSFCSCVAELELQLSFGEHLAESSRMSKLSSSSKGLLYFGRFDEFVVRLQFSSESTLRRPYAFRGGRWLFLSVKKEVNRNQFFSIKFSVFFIECSIFYRPLLSPTRETLRHFHTYNEKNDFKNEVH